MESQRRQPGGYAALQQQANRAELLERIARAAPHDGRVEPLPGVFLFRASSTTEPLHSTYTPAFCVIAQGSKEVLLGEDRYQYDPAHYLLTTVELPVVSQILEASPQQPYLSFRMNLDSALVGSVLVEADGASPRSDGQVQAIDVSPLDASLLDAVVRLMRLMESPSDARILAASVQREIIYRLLTGAQGARLRHLALVGGEAHRVARVVDLLRKNLADPLPIEHIAQELGMSLSGLYHQFRAVTAMSPLQFQKRLRLQEARRLMLGEGLDAASAGFRVGYDDAAYFNRDYKKVFGEPPIRNVERLREDTRDSVVIQGGME